MEAHIGALCDQKNQPQFHPVIHPLLLHQHLHDDCTKLKVKVKSGIAKSTLYMCLMHYIHIYIYMYKDEYISLLIFT